VRGSSHAPKQRAKCVWPREVGSWHPWSQLVIDVLPIDCPDRRWSGAAGLVASKSCVGINKVQATVRGVCLCCCVCDESGCTLPHQSVGRPHMTFRRPSHTCLGVQHAARNGKPRRASKNTQHTRRWEGQGGETRHRPLTPAGSATCCRKMWWWRNWTSTNHTKAWPLRQGTHAGGVVSYGGGAVTSFIFTVGPAWQRPSSAAHTARAGPTPVMATSHQPYASQSVSQSSNRWSRMPVSQSVSHQTGRGCPHFYTVVLFLYFFEKALIKFLHGVAELHSHRSWST
jgi:hypothetical protein